MEVIVISVVKSLFTCIVSKMLKDIYDVSYLPYCFIIRIMSQAGRLYDTCYQFVKSQNFNTLAKTYVVHTNPIGFYHWTYFLIVSCRKNFLLVTSWIFQRFLSLVFLRNLIFSNYFVFYLTYNNRHIKHSYSFHALHVRESRNFYHYTCFTYLFHSSFHDNLVNIHIGKNCLHRYIVHWNMDWERNHQDLNITMTMHDQTRCNDYQLLITLVF